MDSRSRYGYLYNISDTLRSAKQQKHVYIIFNSVFYRKYGYNMAAQSWPVYDLCRSGVYDFVGFFAAAQSCRANDYCGNGIGNGYFAHCTYLRNASFVNTADMKNNY